MVGLRGKSCQSMMAVSATIEAEREAVGVTKGISTMRALFVIRGEANIRRIGGIGDGTRRR